MPLYKTKSHTTRDDAGARCPACSKRCRSERGLNLHLQARSDCSEKLAQQHAAHHNTAPDEDSSSSARQLSSERELAFDVAPGPTLEPFPDARSTSSSPTPPRKRARSVQVEDVEEDEHATFIGDKPLEGERRVHDYTPQAGLGVRRERTRVLE
ncbi:hypothetical protein PENSPDRAFT_657072 [Peniophora sp. CONT]|nr:hypothetical protein PENSPDRAFT_658539 [Peniophora sp. CONT]KZV63712.1 hypothetical protein PENSPDRAFT_657072 [Peniophora sp. CONT]